MHENQCYISIMASLAFFLNKYSLKEDFLKMKFC